MLKMYRFVNVLFLVCLTFGTPLMKIADRLSHLDRGSIRSIVAALDAESLESLAGALYVENDTDAVSAAFNERLRDHSRRSYRAFLVLQNLSEHAIDKIEQALFGTSFYSKRLAQKHESEISRFKRLSLLYSIIGVITAYAAYKSPSSTMAVMHSGLAMFSAMKTKNYLTLIKDLKRRQHALKLV